MKAAFQSVLLASVVVFFPGRADALITGGVGNKPLRDPGWPKGAAAIFNHPGRVAYWEGPPLGGGQWHSECRGDAKALNAVLADFAKIDVKTKRVVVHDGVGYSFWLNPNREPSKKAAAKVDWVFIVWQPGSWGRIRKMPADLNPIGNAETNPPSQIDIYTANIRWADVKVPAGIEVVDNRLEAHGFTLADGVVLEGTARDASNKQPIAATIRLQQVAPQKQGGYQYPTVAETKTDSNGKWVIKQAPATWVRVVVEAAGFVPRVAGHAQFDEQPRWQSYDTSLSTAVSVSGQVKDADGKPLSDVHVSFRNVEPATGGQYASPNEFAVKTDADGRFRMEQVPAGKAAVWIRKQGYVRPGLGQPISTPTSDISLTMMKSASVRVTVDFDGRKKPSSYLVQMEPEGGSKVGTYGGSGNIDAANQMTFKDVPPGKYYFRGYPNPTSESQKTNPILLDLKGGETAELTIKARL
jgi:hypothetical protein